ncbi:MAG: DUF3098 domain-containing protein [Chitinophagaceae bacterium]|nr:DUF3098 domain-containing protein [Chitinophagaceae bacterium]
MKNEIKPVKKGNKPQPHTGPKLVLFGRENVKIMIIGAIIIALGFILMAGGKSSNPNVYDYKAIYSFQRITLAPILIVGGLVVEIFGIMRKPKTE